MAWDSFLTIDPEGPPIGVTRKEWNYAKTKKHFGQLITILGCIFLIFAVFGLLIDIVSKPINQITLNTLLTEKTNLSGRFAITAILKTDESRHLPGIEKEVVYGKINIIAKEITERVFEPGEKNILIPVKPITQQLFNWEFISKSFYLIDGNNKLKLNLDLSQLPITIDHLAHKNLTINRDDQPKYFSQPISVEYAGKVYPINSEVFNYKKTHVTIEREYLIDKQTVTVIALLEKGKIKSIDSITLGTKVDRKEQNDKLAKLLFVTGVFFMFTGFFLFKNGKRHKEALIKFSSQN